MEAPGENKLDAHHVLSLKELIDKWKTIYQLQSRFEQGWNSFAETICCKKLGESESLHQIIKNWCTEFC